MTVSAPPRSSASARPPAANAAIFGAAVLTPFLASLSLSPVAVALAGVTFVLIVALLWRASDPPILLLPVLFQWSEVATWPIATIWKQVPLSDLSSYGADLEQSALYGFAGVSALAIGLRLGSLRSPGASLSERLAIEARQWKPVQVLRIGLGSIAAGYLLAAISDFAGPARELFGNAAGVKYLGVFLVTYWCLLNERSYGLLAGVVIFEILIGLTGFFADFKNSLLTLVIAAMTARPRLRRSDVMIVSGGIAVLVLVATFWSAIKSDYRLMLNQGTGAQVVAVPLEQRLGYVLDALVNVDGDKLAEGFDRLVLRHGYIEYLALVMQNVPASLAHENGQLTLNVISHIAMPRILFTDKPALPSDTEVMAKYTGLRYTWDSNTSISIGNLGELYIDFGFVGGLLAEIAVGFMVGYVYRLLRGNPNCSALLSAGLCVMVVLPVAYFGTAYIKLVGSFIFTSAIAVMLQRYVAPKVALALSIPVASAVAGRGLRSR